MPELLSVIYNESTGVVTQVSTSVFPSECIPIGHAQIQPIFNGTPGKCWKMNTELTHVIDDNDAWVIWESDRIRRDLLLAQKTLTQQQEADTLLGLTEPSESTQAAQVEVNTLVAEFNAL